MSMVLLAEGLFDTAVDLIKTALQQDNSVEGRKNAHDCEEHAKKCLKQYAEIMYFVKGGSR